MAASKKCRRRALLVLHNLHVFSVPTRAVSVNVTIDDQFGDNTTGSLYPTYLPNDGTWHVGSPSEDCDSCKIKPSTLDISQIHDHTWHDATHTPGLTPAQIIVNFTGTAVYVYNIVPNFLPNNTATFANISFTLDGSNVGSFLRPPDPSTEVIQYNQPIHSSTGLENVPHTLVMTAGGDTKSLILFDYVVYTTESNVTSTTFTASTSTPLTSRTIVSSTMTTSESTLAAASTPSTAKPVGVIIGGVLGGLALILIAGVAGLLFLRRRKAQGHARRERSEQIPSHHDDPQLEAYREPHGLSEDSGNRYRDSHPPLIQHTSGVHVSSNPGSGYEFGGRLWPAGPNPLTRPSAHMRRETESSATSPGTTATRTSKRREVLAQRIDLLQREMSMLSSPRSARAGSEVSSGGGNSTALRALEEEVSRLRIAFASVSTQLEEQSRDTEHLPAYEE
ncbi:hypothetical protein BD311DRAFT_791981 [Dichomitus squalens]|uniref:Mid2 domain-containing protein n=1 Tax=Dichomitus squalens TaxID=114155 RepID=A0A4Q9M8W1_9APHY|nr:hypothetical protein BD311DRAFT_791981 [Dichomitus squalens]